MQSHYSEADARTIFRQLIQAIQYLQSRYNRGREGGQGGQTEGAPLGQEGGTRDSCPCSACSRRWGCLTTTSRPTGIAVHPPNRWLCRLCRGVVHRDIKLKNLLLLEPGDLNHVKLTDFG